MLQCSQQYHYNIIQKYYVIIIFIIIGNILIQCKHCKDSFYGSIHRKNKEHVYSIDWYIEKGRKKKDKEMRIFEVLD